MQIGRVERHNRSVFGLDQDLETLELRPGRPVKLVSSCKYRCAVLLALLGSPEWSNAFSVYHPPTSQLQPQLSRSRNENHGVTRAYAEQCEVFAGVCRCAVIVLQDSQGCAIYRSVRHPTVLVIPLYVYQIRTSSRDFRAYVEVCPTVRTDPPRAQATRRSTDGFIIVYLRQPSSYGCSDYRTEIVKYALCGGGGQKVRTRYVNAQKTLERHGQQ
jgi:hypothetical protein